MLEPRTPSHAPTKHPATARPAAPHQAPPPLRQAGCGGLLTSPVGAGSVPVSGDTVAAHTAPPRSSPLRPYGLPPWEAAPLLSGDLPHNSRLGASSEIREIESSKLKSDHCGVLALYRRNVRHLLRAPKEKLASHFVLEGRGKKALKKPFQVECKPTPGDGGGLQVGAEQ